jgi:hypothetical protein
VREAVGVAFVENRLADGHRLRTGVLYLVATGLAAGLLATAVAVLVIGIMLNTGALSADAWLRGVTHPGLTLGLAWTYLSVYLVAFLVTLPVAVARAHWLRPVGRSPSAGRPSWSTRACC